MNPSTQTQLYYLDATKSAFKGGAESDAAINSDVIRAIRKKVLYFSYDSKKDCFTANIKLDHGIQCEHWSICIEDQHDTEGEPHYVFKLTDGTPSNNDGDCYTHVVRVRYLDFHSVTANEDAAMKGTITQALGYYTVTVKLGGITPCTPPNAIKNITRNFATDIHKAYLEAMEKHLPNYAIVTEIVSGG